MRSRWMLNLVVLVTLPASTFWAQTTKRTHTSAPRVATQGNPRTDAVLWRRPEDIAALNLYYGQGGEPQQPKAPFVFVVEDTRGSNPKFDARDAEGKKWRVKLGEESRPEVVASRLLWAVGYLVNDDYLLPKAQIQGLSLGRTSNSARGYEVTDARFARKPAGQKKAGSWKWKENPFTGSRELNGLRVMMALMNNWDLKDENNAVYEDAKTGKRLFLVSDVGATFGTNGLSWSLSRSKGNLAGFKGSKFITRETETEVDFATPAAPKALLAQSVGTGVVAFAKRRGLDWIGKKIPRDDVRWIASLLGQLTHQQLVDAFCAGNFPQEEVDEYVSLVESRIAALQEL